MKTFKVTCEFYIKARDKWEAEEIVSDDISEGEFLDEHIMIEETTDKISKEDIYNK
jgi:hypothetical protein